MQWAVRVNEAWFPSACKDPLRRAAYLCELRGGSPIDGRRQHRDAGCDFLLQQIEWREALDDARFDATPRSKRLARRLQSRAHERAALGDAGSARLDERGDAYAAAAQQVRAR